jgi:hypothetical protein
MLKKKIKGLFLTLANESIKISYICKVTNSSEKEVLKIIAELEIENFIE